MGSARFTGIRVGRAKKGLSGVMRARCRWGRCSIVLLVALPVFFHSYLRPSAAGDEPGLNKKTAAVRAEDASSAKLTDEELTDLFLKVATRKDPKSGQRYIRKWSKKNHVLVSVARLLAQLPNTVAIYILEDYGRI